MAGALLLDTCVMIWTALNKPMDAGAVAAMNADNILRVSPISVWELGLLFAKGRMSATSSPIALFSEVVATRGIKVEALTPEILVKSSFLPGHIHSDPADRILIATARERDLTIVTRDEAILAYGAAGHVKTLEC
jgi:PIN domain nuclease of toxin-antitoxin system